MPLIATNCITDNGLYPVYETERFVSTETYQDWFRGHPKPGDIIFVCKGKPGVVAMAPDPVDFCIAQDMVAVRANPKEVYPKYLFAVLRSKIIRQRIDALHVGTMIPHFKKGDFDKLSIPLIDEDQQRLVGDLYFDLSSKIESNRRLARVIQESMRTELRNSLTFGSEVTILGELFESVQDRVTLTDPTLPYVGLEHFTGFDLSLWRFGVAGDSKSATKVAQPGDLLFGRIRPYFGNVAILGQTAVVAQSVEVLRSRKVHYTEIAQLAASSSDFIQVATTLASGTTMPQVKWSDLRSIEVQVPIPSVAEKFHQYAAPLAQMLAKLPMESEHLADIRDALLPELLSGRLRVRDVEKVVEEVV